MSKGGKILGVLLGLGVLSGQVYYFTNIHPKYKQTIETLNVEVASQEQTLISLENGLKRLPQTRQELKDTQLEVQALIERMPSYSSAAKDLSEMMRGLESSRFINIEVQPGESIEHTYQNQVLIEKVYTLTYIAPFSEAKAFVESLNSAYQIINIKAFQTDNYPQIDEENGQAYRLIYGEKFKELVETTVSFSLFMNPTRDIEEAYSPSTDILVDPENAFRNMEGTWNPSWQELGKNKTLVDMPVRKNETKFELDIKNVSDKVSRYTFKAPKGFDQGMNSQEKVYVEFILTKTGYQVVLKDHEGNEKQIADQLTINAPVLKINSQLVTGKSAPEVHLSINNQTEEVMVIDIEGTMLGNLHIYNEKGEEVNRGSVKGQLIIR